MHNDKLITTILIYCMSLLLAVFICTLAVKKEAAAQSDPEYTENITPTEGIGSTIKLTPTPSLQATKIPTPTIPIQNQVTLTPTSSAPDSVLTDAWEQLRSKIPEEVQELLGERCIIFRKPKAYDQTQGLTISISDLPVDRSLGIRVEGCENTELSEENFERIVLTEYFCGIPKAEDSDPLQSLHVDYTMQEDESYVIAAELQLDQPYYYYLYESDNYYYISLVNARTVFPKIVVLDAGHGGWDNGTSSVDGRLLEKDINLSVVMYLKEFLEENTDIAVYCTRTTDCNLTQTQRIELANSLEADFFLSIHCNNAYKNPNENGIEVLYAQQQKDWGGVNSMKLASLCLSELLEKLSLSNRGLVPGAESLTILREAQVPAVINEIGFLSNASDMAVMEQEVNQKAAAEAIYHAILRAYEIRDTE